MNQKLFKISTNAAVGLGIAAGFAFLIGLGAALNVLPGSAAILICLSIPLFAFIGLLLSRK